MGDDVYVKLRREHVEHVAEILRLNGWPETAKALANLPQHREDGLREAARNVVGFAKLFDEPLDADEKPATPAQKAMRILHLLRLVDKLAAALEPEPSGETEKDFKDSADAPSERSADHRELVQESLRGFEISSPSGMSVDVTCTGCGREWKDTTLMAHQCRGKDRPANPDSPVSTSTQGLRHFEVWDGRTFNGKKIEGWPDRWQIRVVPVGNEKRWTVGFYDSERDAAELAADLQRQVDRILATTPKPSGSGEGGRAELWKDIDRVIAWIESDAGFVKHSVRFAVSRLKEASKLAANPHPAPHPEQDRADDWQPIETAPKDGAKIVVWQAPWNEASTARWFDDEWHIPFVVAPVHPTCWKPLPKPPGENDTITPSRQDRAVELLTELTDSWEAHLRDTEPEALNRHDDAHIAAVRFLDDVSKGLHSVTPEGRFAADPVRWLTGELVNADDHLTLNGFDLGALMHHNGLPMNSDGNYGRVRITYEPVTPSTTPSPEGTEASE